MSDVAAVIVTRNRSKLLLSCLRALRVQESPLAAIFVINNASTDDTLDSLAADGWTVAPNFHLITLEKNVGGSGGFHRGMAEAHAAGHQWLWIMDDDCLASPSSLRTLLEASASFEEGTSPLLLSSRVEWTDGRIHPLNVVAVKDSDKEFLYTAALHNTLSIRSATFVSLLAHRSAVERYGLPNAVYFLWMDDIEWTARVLRHERGVLVPSSVVTHCTERAQNTLEAPPARFYFYIRNSLWMLLGSDCFSPREKCARGSRMLVFSLLWMSRRWWHISAWMAVMRAYFRGIFPPLRSFEPKSRVQPSVNRTVHIQPSNMNDTGQ